MITIGKSKERGMKVEIIQDDAFKGGKKGGWRCYFILGGKGIVLPCSVDWSPGDHYSTPCNAKRGFRTWRKKALVELGATGWRSFARSKVEFEVIR